MQQMLPSFFVVITCLITLPHKCTFPLNQIKIKLTEKLSHFSLLTSFITRMPSKADASKKIPLAEIEKDFHTFFEECSKLNNFQRFQVLFPLKYRKWRSLALKYGVLVLIVVFLLFIGFYVDFFAWHLAAVGRISLGQLKSVWQWEDLYKAKCLVGRPFNEKSEEKGEEEERGSFIDFKDCAVCENIGK